MASWLIAAHLAEIAVWALLYTGFDVFPDAESSWYFSAVTYTTVGYGDLVPPPPWRLLAGVEGLTGILMCGWSTAFFFAVFSRIHPDGASTTRPWVTCTSTPPTMPSCSGCSRALASWEQPTRLDRPNPSAGSPTPRGRSASVVKPTTENGVLVVRHDIRSNADADQLDPDNALDEGAVLAGETAPYDAAHLVEIREDPKTGGR